MVTVFILCHEGEIPYVMAGLRDALSETSAVQIVDQGSTEKIHMGYLLLQGEGELPTALLAELLANPDIYLYAFHRPGDLVEGSAELEAGADAREPGAPAWWEEPVPVEL